VVSGPYLLPGPDGTSAYEIACLARDGPSADRTHFELLIRRFEAGKGMVTENTFPLAEPLAGTPAVGPNFLVLPLASGELFQQPFDGPGRPAVSWRSRRARRGAFGHVLYLGGQDFLSTDGLQGLTRWHWPADEPTEVKSRELEHPLGGAPAVISADGVARLIVVADSQGNVELLQAGDLAAARHWALNGQVTSGPFVRGQAIGCMVDGTRLVWLDPGRDQPAWEHRTAEPVAGRPQVVGGVVVVADRSGRVVGLDLASGKPRGRGFTVPAGLSPAVGPVPFGPDRLFAPLTDGTAVLLPAARFRGE
jgi:hypothetical protein